MRLVWVVVVLVLVAVGFDWAVEKGKQESKRLEEKPRSEKYIAGSLDRGKAGAAAIAIHDYKNAFMQYKLTKTTNPQSLKDLVKAGLIQPGMDRDPFGQEYELKYEGKEAVISSPGADRVRGTPDDIVQRIPVD